MKARLFTNILRRGHVAGDYVPLVESRRHGTPAGVDDPKSREAQKILETLQDSNEPEYELDINIAGKDLIWQLDHDLDDLGLVPYHFSSAARAAGEVISVGSRVGIPGDERQFRVVSISSRDGSVQIRDADSNQYLVPWGLVRPWRECNDNRAETVSAQRKSIDSKTVMRAVGNWFFGKSRVYRLSEPDRILKQRKIHWDRESCDVQDADGRVFLDVPWDDLEFADEVEFHLPDED